MKAKSEIFRYYYFIMICCIVMSFLLMSYKNSYCQKATTEKNIFKAEREDLSADKVDSLNELAWKYRFLDPKKAYNFGWQAGQMSKDLGYNIGSAKSYVNIGYIFILTKNDFENATICFKRADRILNKSKDENEIKKLEAKICEGYGLINFKLHEYELAIKNYEDALNIYRQISMSYSVSNCYHSIGLIYDKIGYKMKAKQNFHKELANIESINRKLSKKNSIKPEIDNTMVSLEDIKGVNKNNINTANSIDDDDNFDTE